MLLYRQMSTPETPVMFVAFEHTFITSSPYL